MESKRGDFVERSCPYCHGRSFEKLFDLKAIDFCPLNWTYSKEYSSLLELSDELFFPVVRCLSCGFIYALLLPSDEFLHILYNEVIDVSLAEQGATTKFDYARRLRYCSQLLQLCPQSGQTRVLDFGAGYGLSSVVLGVAGCEVLSFDPSHTRVEKMLGRGVQVVDSLSELQKSAPFDVIICDNVLEHVPDIHQTSQLFSECLTHDGLLYISVPSYEKNVVRRLLKDFSLHQLSDMTLNPWEHLNYFDLCHLDTLLADYGFQPLRRCELSAPVDIGLRAEVNVYSRYKNGLASMIRLLKYSVMGTVNESVNDRIYRFGGRS
ncbi:MAG: hypothetical protein DSY58_06745 [Desulfobulbus sp.]|nr:MAG: hypothetical protein DSY58_06745 [Desulfobulbus sp.]